MNKICNELIQASFYHLIKHAWEGSQSGKMGYKQPTA